MQQLLKALLIALVGCALMLSNSAEAKLAWHWDDGFSDTQKAELTDWLVETHQALERFAGPLPFDVHIHMKRARRGSGPVPWANTWREDEQELYFHVNPELPSEAFFNDWTAPHEFSHLLLPYLGRDNAWFAEGFASYLQHAVMVELGVLTPSEAASRRDRKIASAVAALESAESPLPEAVPELKRRRAYPTFYWGGAVFFERADKRLAALGAGLQSVIRTYLDCCRMTPVASLDELVALLDEASGTRVFSSELQTMRREPGCPARLK